jgi:hypothetical protein
MALIEKGDLKYDYSWDARPGNNPVHEGESDSNLFDRESGKEVLTIINEYASRRNITDKKEALRIERELHENLSRDITTQRDVMDWLDSIFS